MVVFILSLSSVNKTSFSTMMSFLDIFLSFGSVLSFFLSSFCLGPKLSFSSGSLLSLDLVACRFQ